MLLGLTGLALLAVILANQLLWFPPALEPFGQAAHRLAILFVLPARMANLLILPPRSHQWPVWHFVVTCMTAPYLYWGVFLGVRAAGRALVAWGRTRSSALAPEAVTRRVFLARVSSGAVVLAGAGALGYAAFLEPARFRIRRYEIPIRGLPPVFDGLKLVHVSDTHYGPYNSLPFVRRVIARASALEADLAVFTGDHVHFTARSVEPGIRALDEIRTRWGAVAVLGNHEYWEGARLCRDTFHGTRIRLLENTRVFLTPDGLTDPPGSKPALCIGGVGDFWEGQVLFDRALEGAPEDMPRLVLSHNPDTAELLHRKQRVDLLLCGHTHGGQVAMPGLGPLVTGSKRGRKYLGGLCQGPRCPVLVSRGAGCAGLPVRFGVVPEIGLITLRRL